MPFPVDCSGPRAADRLYVGRLTIGPRLVSITVILVVVFLLDVGPAAAKTETVELLGGDVLRGEVVERTADRMILEHPVLGRLQIPTSQLAPTTLHPGVLGTSVLRGWTKELAIGLGGSVGDTDEADLRATASLEMETDRKRWRVDGRYDLGFADKEIDNHDAHLTALRDWLWPQSKWFAFAYGLYDYDDFEAWKHRVTAGAGPGYHLYKTVTFRLDTRVGPFITYEFGSEDDARPEAAAGLFADWKLGDRHTLLLYNVYFETLDRSARRNVSRLGWKIRLSLISAVSLKLTIDNEYDSISDKSRNNLKYFTNVVLDF
jgi:putative salt-induced outer membrane protein YdiY